MTSAFGQIVVASQLENAVCDLLRKWFPTYLREIERIMEWEREPLPTPRNYTNRNSFDAQSGEEIPKVAVISPGLFNPPTHPESDGYYKAIWQLGIGVATAAPTEELADAQAKMYGAAARAILLQHQDLEKPDIVTAVTWLDENYDDLPIEDQLAQYRSASIFLGIEVAKTTSRYMRPPDVSEAPQIINTVEEVITEIHRSDNGGITVITN